MNKKIMSRKKRAKKTRSQLDRLKATRITIDRSNKHIRAQVICVGEGNQHRVLVSASSLEAAIAAKEINKTQQAVEVGKLLAQRAVDSGVNKVAFDRNGYRYHGRIRALADAAREAGLNI